MGIDNNRSGWKLKTVFSDEKAWLLLYVILFMVIHGEMAFNKLSWHDDLNTINGFHEGIIQGRITHVIITNILIRISGIESLPVVNCLAAAICIVIIGQLIFDAFNIHRPIVKFALMLVFMSIPALAGNAGYMTTFGINMIGALLAVLAAYYAVHHDGMVSAMMSAVLLMFAIGEYQCYLTFFFSFLLCSVCKRVIYKEESLKSIFSILRRYLIITIVALFLYFGLLRVFLIIYNTDLTSYAGINTYGLTSIMGYIERIKNAYVIFLNPPRARYNMFPFHWTGWYRVVLLLLYAGFIINIIRLFRRKSLYSGFLLTLCAIVSPILFNFNIIIYDIRPLHALHQYHFIMIFVLIVLLYDSLANAEVILDKWKYIKEIKNKSTVFIACYIIALGCQYVRYDNLCYMDAEVQQQQTISYFTTLVSDIHNTEGYRSDLPVSFVFQENQLLPTYNVIARFDATVTNPYQDRGISANSWYNYMYHWCNFKPASVIAPESLSDNIKSEVEMMPHYPDSGSIRIIDGILIVSF